MKKLSLLFIFLSIILLSACSSRNNSRENELLDAELEKLENEYIQTVSEISTVKNLLIEFEDWEGSKEPNKTIYTLNLNNDAYILTINPNQDNNQIIDWVDMYYFKSIDENVINTSELEPMSKLVSIVSPNFNINNQWFTKIISGELPYEERYKGYLLHVDYYIYNDKKAGIYLKISSIEPYTDNEVVIEENSILDNRHKLASSIQEALNASGHPAICTSVYFNNEGELIIEATSYWGNMSESDKEDIMFLIKGILANNKENLNIEGYGQFFSPAGRGLESFYAD